MALDPALKEMLLAQRQRDRAGKKYKTPPVIPEIAKAYQNDPRTQLAVQALANGTSDAPVAEGKYAYADGIARALTGVAGGYINKQQQQEYGKHEDTLRDTRYIRGLEGLNELTGEALPVATPQPPAPAPAPDQASPQPSPQTLATANAAAPLVMGPGGGQPPPAARPGLPVTPSGLPVAQRGGTPGGGTPFPLQTPGGAISLASGRDALKAQGARITSSYRTPAKQRALIAQWEANGRKGVRPADNSFHTRGTPDNPQAYDFVPKQGESMALLQIKARKAFPGFDVINEGDHVHVEPSRQGTATMDTRGNAVPPPPPPPGAEEDTLLPTPEIAARPERPTAVGPQKSKLLEAAYRMMIDDNPYESAQSQEYYGTGLSEQGKFNEAAAAREQALISDEFGAGLDRWKTSAGAADADAYATNQAILNDRRGLKQAREGWAATASEGSLNRANQLMIAREGDAASIAAAQAKLGTLKKPPAKIATGHSTNSAAIKQIDAAIAKIKANHGATGLQNLPGDDWSQRVDPKGVPVRAAVANIGSLKRHDRSGASVTVGEQPYLKPFIPTVTDRWDVAIKKLEGLKEEYVNANAGIEIDFGQEAGYSGFGTPSADTPLTAAEAAELARLKAGRK